MTSVCVCVQDKAKEKSSRFDTLRHSLAGMIRSPKTMLGSSTSVSLVIKILLFHLNHQNKPFYSEMKGCSSSVID